MLAPALPDLGLLLAREAPALVQVAVACPAAHCHEAIVRLERAALPVPALVAVRGRDEAAFGAAIDLQGALVLVDGAQQGAVAVIAVHQAAPARQ